MMMLAPRVSERMIVDQWVDQAECTCTMKLYHVKLYPKLKANGNLMPYMLGIIHLRVRPIEI